MEPKKSALNNAMSAQAMIPPKQPGDRTDVLLSAIKALQSYAKDTMELDPEDVDLKMVRTMISSLSTLLKKDQAEEKDGKHIMPDGSLMENEEMAPPAGGEDVLAGAPQMPDISNLGILQ